MITLAIFIILALTLYFYMTRKFKYWKKRGVKHDRPVAIFGNNIKGFLFLATVSQISEEQYWKYPKEKVVGFFRAAKPELIIRDPELAKRILITDFHHFYRRGVIPPETAFEPLLQNLFFADGDLWKLLRQRLTPTFTSGKLKAMFPLIVERAERLQARVLTMANEKKAIDARELMARFTTDFIGAVAFGLDTDTLNEEDSSFRKLGNKMFKLTFFNMITALLKFVLPKVFKNLKILAHLEKDMNMLLGEIIRQRNGKPSGRNDFIDLLLECKLKGKIIGESIEKRKEDGTPETATLEFNDSIIVAQVFVFFAAGFETSSISTSYALHQLAYNPDFQKKAQDEIDRVLKKHDGRLSYDAIKEMVYLEWIFKEALRLVPPLGFLIRQCVKPCHFPELNLSIDEGVNVLIPIQAMQTDPKYFEAPAEFRPERHDPKKFDSRNKYVYLPFGEGPRSCIGERLALMQSLAGLTAILAKFSVEPAPETKRHPVISTKTGMLQGFLGGLPLLFRERPKAI